VTILPSKPYFAPGDIDFILNHFRDILEGNSFLSNFKWCEEFERRFAAYHGSRYGVSCNSGTSALELCFRAMNIVDREVIVPAVTFSATAFAPLRAGNRVVFAESADDMSMDPADVETLIHPRTAAVVTVHIGGHISPSTRDLQALCRDKGIVLIEDAAHAHGSALDGQKAGTFGHASAFSFFSTKVMTTGEGGMVTSDDATVRDRCMLIRNYAKKDGRNYHEEYGSSLRLTEVQALMGLTQLAQLDAFIERRNRLAEIYRDGFADEPSLVTLTRPPECQENYYKYIVLLPEQVERAAYTRALKEDFSVSLGGPVYDIPLHHQPVFAPFATRALPKAEELCRRHICPPMYHTMTDEDAVYVVDAMRKTLRRFL